DVLHQLRELREGERLRPILDRLFGIRMRLDDQAVRARRDRAQADRVDQAALAGGVRGSGEDGQVGKLLNGRNRIDVEGVARVGLEGADAALAQDDLVVAL